MVILKTQLNLQDGYTATEGAAAILKRLLFEKFKIKPGNNGYIINLTPKDQPSENYNDLIMKYLKKELSCEGDLNGSKQLGLRGRFNNQSIEGVLVNFINIYLKCFSCKSPRTYLSKINKKLYKNCLTCNSVSCVNL